MISYGLSFWKSPDTPEFHLILPPQSLARVSEQVKATAMDQQYGNMEPAVIEN